jgi:protein-tyrosine phosphatase
MERHLSWDGCANVRDLGGLGGIRRGALVRADDLQNLTAAGWAALGAHGIRTVVDLRNPDEIGADSAPRPPGLTTVRIPLDGMEDTEFWSRWLHRPEFGTPHYYRPWLERFPDRAARALAAIARAQPGGVAYHCGVGRDRTGLITGLICAALGVRGQEAAEDYALSAPIEDYWEAQPETPAEVFARVMAGVDPARYLSAEDRRALEARAS